MPSRSNRPSSRPSPVYRVLCLACASIIAFATADSAFGQSGGSSVTAGRTNSLQSQDEGLSLTRQEDAKAYAAERGWRTKETLPDGGLMELQAIYNGRPYYYRTTNRTAADSVSTDECWPGGLSGYNLTGSGVTLGIWDGGAVRTTHQEFGGRAVQRDSGSSYGNHPTHVAGTMVAAGVNAAAKGMSFEANLNCYDWNADTSEMNSEARAGLRVSNHSYGPVTGWFYDYDCTDGTGGRWWWIGDVTVSEVEDYRFGFYYYDAEQYDEVAYDNQRYLICCSAGNDRNEGPGGTVWHCYFNENGELDDISGVFRNNDGGNSGGYDTISGSGIGKNVLCVGAVEDVVGGYTQPSGVVMTSFSCWGPADDGRIKPDIVGNGTRLFSPLAGSNTAYPSLGDDWSGTSMSSPNVAGSLGLLIEHWRATHPAESDMLSSTLKGLVLHTADECGANDGPDYVYGWGLLNTWKAADVISQDIILPGTISEQYVSSLSPFQITLTTNGTSSELRATICWIDMPGDVPPAAVDPTTRMLVNDLDMSITSPSSQTYRPWVLDRTNPTAAATTGDNNVDNVEQIVIKNPGSGTWTLNVAADGALANGFQRFSLIITGASGIMIDCNDNGTMDHLDLAGGTSEDCNANQVPDECELAVVGNIGDCNDDGVLDECQLAGNDCNNNGVIDSCDVAGGDSEDCNNNGEPDECELDTPLVQLPNSYTGVFADSDCDICDAGAQTVAENFTLTEQKAIGSVVIWGGYYPDNTPMDTDDFVIRFLEDDEGALGTLVTAVNNPTPLRDATGKQLFGSDEYKYTFIFNPPITLEAGSYYIEIYNDTSGNTDSFFWESGNVDVVHGTAGSYWDIVTPATAGGTYDATTDFAITMAVVSPDVDCNADGLLDECYPALAVDLGPDRELAPSRTHSPIAPNMDITGGSGDLSYHWQIISGPSALGIGSPYAENPSFTPPAEGVYIVRCSVQDSSVGPCTAYDDMVITVAPLDVALPETLYGCVETQTLPLGNIPLAIGGTPPYNYLWEVLEGPSEFTEISKTRSNPTLTPPSLENYVVQVTATDSSNPAYAITKTAQIVVADPPSVNAGQVAQYHPIIMIGDVLNLGGAPTATGGHPPYSYGWSIPLNPDGAASISDVTAANPTFTATAKGGYLVRVQITDQGGCSAETQFTISVVSDAPSSLVPITGNPSGIACGLCAPTSAATIALLCVGYLALCKGLRMRRRR